MKSGEQVTIRLFVAGNSPRSQNAVQQANRIVESLPTGFCCLEVVDVLTNAHLAETHRVLATPTLLRAFPLPPLRVVGDLSNTDKVLQILDILQTPGWAV